MPTPIFSIAVVTALIMVLGVIGLLGAEAERKSRTAAKRTQNEKQRLTNAVTSWQRVVVMRKKPMTTEWGLYEELLGRVFANVRPHRIESTVVESRETKQNIVRSIERLRHEQRVN
jgi:hypothetical protein